MTISTFIVGLEQSHWITRTGGEPGPAGQTLVAFGDVGKGGGSLGRRSTYHSWDIDGIPKNAIIDEAYVEFVPSSAHGDIDSPNHTHVMALMYADGHWNRSEQNELHQAQGAPYYNAPAQTDTLDFTARNTADIEIADTMPDTTGQAWFSNELAAFQSLGCTIEIPANENLKTVRVQMSRLHAPDPNAPTLKVNAYTLAGNGRQYALGTLIASSQTVAYGSLALDPASSDIDFTFAIAIPAQSTVRWIGLMIEGEIFDGAWTGTQSYQLRRRSHASQTSYLAGTAGSWIHANIDTDIANANSLVGYLNERSVPCLYPVSSSTLITTPYARYFGIVMSKTECGPWTIGVSKTYGSAVADEEFPNFVQNLQDWIDSAHYSPSEGKTWIGFMFDIALPENVTWWSAGPTHATYPAHKLILDWHMAPADITVESFDIEPSFSVESFAVETTIAAESEAIEPSITVKSGVVEELMTSESAEIEVVITAEAAVLAPDFSAESLAIEPSITKESLAIEKLLTAESAAIDEDITAESAAAEPGITAESAAVEPTITAITPRGGKE